MFGIRDKKDIDTIKQLEELIDYLKKELDDTKNELAQLKITADLRLKEIDRLRTKLPEEEKTKESKTRKRRTVAKKRKIVL
jgi:regulator of replication initiation timing